MLEPMLGVRDLLVRLQSELGPERLPLVIGIDGRGGAGKSSLAFWLAWQLGMPAVSLDLYVIRDSEPLEWRYEDLGRLISARMKLRRPIIVEGICLCQSLHAFERGPDFLIWVENAGGPEPYPGDPTNDYLQDFDPKGNADVTLEWRQPEIDCIRGKSPGDRD
jgi:hypothetical protein